MSVPMGCASCADDDCRIFRGRIKCCEVCERSALAPQMASVTLP